MEKRTISLDINQAKEWYNMGGVYKTLALLAYTEQELNPKELCKTWEDFFKNVMLDQRVFYIDSQASIRPINVSNPENCIFYRNSCASVEIARAHRALMQLHMLRDYYNKGWNAESDTESDVYVIKHIKGDLKTIKITKNARTTSNFLTFKDEEVAFMFLHNFTSLIMEACTLI